MIQGQKAWDYSHTEHAWPVCHVFMPGSKQLNDYGILKQKLNLIQQTESNNHLRGGVVNLYNTMETSWIVAMHKMGYRYACIWFDGAWADTHDFNLKLLDEIDRINIQGKWLAAGQIQDRTDEYPFFTRSIMLLNIDTWMNVDQPNPHIQPSEYPDYFVMTDPNWEDSVFSIHEISSEFKSRDFSSISLSKQELFGNAWIPWALRRHLIVPGISDKLMEFVTFTRPLNGTQDFELALQGKDHNEDVLSHQARRIKDKLFKIHTPIYFVNTESSKPELAEQLIGSSFDQYVGPTAGFKMLYYAHKYGFDNNTRFVFFDFDADSVRFKEDTLRGWDGVDYVKWVDDWCYANPEVNTELHPLVKERWPSIVNSWGGPQKWQEFWLKIQMCDWEVVHVDLINEYEKLLNTLTMQRTFFWGSNIYSYLTVQLLSKPFQVERSFIELMQNLNNLDSDCWFSGTDIQDNDLMCPVRNILTTGDNRYTGFE